MKRRGRTFLDKAVHDAQSSNTTPMGQALQLDAFCVPNDANSPHLDAVKSVQPHLSTAHPNRATILELRANERLVDRSQCRRAQHCSRAAKKTETAVGVAIHVGDVLLPGHVVAHGEADHFDVRALRDSFAVEDPSAGKPQVQGESSRPCAGRSCETL